MIEEILLKLTKNEKMIICGHFVLGMNGAEIARDLNISRERVRQIKKDIFKKFDLNAETQKQESRTGSQQGYIRLISIGPPVSLAVCDLAGNLIQEIKPNTRVKILRNDDNRWDSQERKEIHYRSLKRRAKNAQHFAKFGSRGGF